MKKHFWQGTWIDDQELSTKIAQLEESMQLALQNPLGLEELLQACDKVSARLTNDTVFKDKLLSAVLESQEASVEDFAATLPEIAEFLTSGTLRKKLLRELGSESPFSLRRQDSKQSHFEAWAPVGLLVHVAPTNALAVPFLGALEGLLCLNVNLLKLGSSAGLFTALLCEALVRADESGKLGPYLMVLKVSSAQQETLKVILSHADAVSVWGGEEAVASIRALTPHSARFIEWGHKISFALVSKKASKRLKDSDFEHMAREMCFLDQQSCSSPQVLYFEDSTFEQLCEHAQRLELALNKVAPQIPFRAPQGAEAAEITKIKLLHQSEAALRDAKVISAQDVSWLLLVDSRPGLEASPLYRTLWIKPLERKKALQTLRPLRNYLQTVGLVAENTELVELSELLYQAGALRVRSLGSMVSSYEGEPHDGVYALTRYARRVSLDLLQQLKGITDFSELKKSELKMHSISLPLMGKEQFQELSKNAKGDLYFKSGGSSGEPKISVFTYEDYHAQMRAAADGLVAAGFDSQTDRAMNLFHSGSLYGGFISFFTILEFIKATQFPMTAFSDLRFVAETIVRHKVNVLLGMPSYIWQLFSEQAALLKTANIKKIFYGGEHFSESQRQFLKDNFGVEVLHSATYGSVDAGPLGYQCLESQGGVHHLHVSLQDLEILDLQKDQPVELGQIGRLVFSSKHRSSLNLQRYEIGDLGRWVSEELCACGRGAPRFELLGRYGDVFRVAGTYINFAKILKILEEECHFKGELQAILSRKENFDQLTLQLSEESKLDLAEAHRLLEKNYADLKEVVNEGVLKVEFKSLPLKNLLRTTSSGKLLRVADQRTYSK